MAASDLMRLLPLMPKQQKCGQQNDGHGNGHRRKVERGGHGKSAEANMGQPVPDHRIPLEYQADALSSAAHKATKAPASSARIIKE